jgi:formylglycine-generating enzyme required for sulfatase activity
MPIYQPGDIILRDFQIEAFIGQGGYGEVYRARQIHVNQSFALKILQRSDMTESGFAEAERRFRQEAQLGLLINHPSIVRVYNFSLDEASNQLVLVMAYAAGGNLKQALDLLRDRNRPFSIRNALRVSRQMAGGLAALHAAGVVHRDLSPNNILFDSTGRALISDLGLAQTANTLSPRMETSKEPPPQPGTPGYRSPEHSDGYTLLQPPADVYALGLLLFEMLTLKQYGFCPPLTRVSSLRPGIPVVLDDLVMKMLSEDFRQRPWDGAAAEKALSAVTERILGTPEPLLSGKAPVSDSNLEEGLTALQDLEDAREWGLAVDLLRRLEARHPNHPKLMRHHKLISQGQQEKSQAEAAARREIQEKAAREAADNARRMAADQARQAELVRKKMAAEARVRQNAERKKKFQTAAGRLNSWFAAIRKNQKFKDGLGFLVSRFVAWGVSVLLVMLVLKVFGLGREISVTATETPIVNPPPTANPLPVVVPVDDPPPCTEIGQTWISPVDGMTLVCVPAGDFLMGLSEAEATLLDNLIFSPSKPQHTVYLDAYWMDRTEVTNAQYLQCVNAGVCRKPRFSSSAKHLNYYGNSEFANYPVIYVSWDDAAVYCRWAGRQLPSSAQWEKAARGTDGRLYPWGNQMPDSGLANFNGNVGGPTAVGSYPYGASPYGALDMAGNVSEFVADYYDYKSFSSKPSNRRGFGTECTVRGGRYLKPFGLVGDLRSAVQYFDYPTSRKATIGFRCLYHEMP